MTKEGRCPRDVPDTGDRLRGVGGRDEEKEPRDGFTVKEYLLKWWSVESDPVLGVRNSTYFRPGTDPNQVVLYGSRTCIGVSSSV